MLLKASVYPCIFVFYQRQWPEYEKSYRPGTVGLKQAVHLSRLSKLVF